MITTNTIKGGLYHVIRKNFTGTQKSRVQNSIIAIATTKFSGRKTHLCPQQWLLQMVPKRRKISYLSPQKATQALVIKTSSAGKDKSNSISILGLK